MLLNNIQNKKVETTRQLSQKLHILFKYHLDGLKETD